MLSFSSGTTSRLSVAIVPLLVPFVKLSSFAISVVSFMKLSLWRENISPGVAKSKQSLIWMSPLKKACWIVRCMFFHILFLLLFKILYITLGLVNLKPKVMMTLETSLMWIGNKPVTPDTFWIST